jgi:lipoprotein NlpI
MNSSNLLEQELIHCHNVIFSHPHEPKAYVHRGMVHFKLANINESIADFDTAEKLDPRLTPYLWQRGLSYYYAEQFALGAKQFEIDLTINSQDVEETVWHYLCVARLYSPVQARQSLLEVRNDPRLVMRRVYDLYAGNSSVDDFVLAAGSSNDKRESFYSYLYLGLYFEVESQLEPARQYMRKAVSHQIDDYMWHLATVHQKLRGWD